MKTFRKPFLSFGQIIHNRLLSQRCLGVSLTYRIDARPRKCIIGPSVKLEWDGDFAIWDLHCAWHLEVLHPCKKWGRQVTQVESSNLIMSPVHK